MKTIFKLVIAVSIVTACSAFAQTERPSESPQQTGNWTAWLGCWHLAQQDVRAANSDISRDLANALGNRPSSRRRSARSEPIQVCVSPMNQNAVKMTTFVDGQSVLEQTIFTDGISHPVNESECRGSQTSEWSRDGQRVFTRAEVECKGQPKRIVSGVTLIARGPAWYDIQAIELDGDQQVRIRRYERAESDRAAELPRDIAARATTAAEALAATPIGVDDVTEASSKVASHALEAALLETGSQFQLNSRELIKLADNGVPRNVIDLMVALSYPDRFQVERTAAAGSNTMFGGGLLGPLSLGLYDPYGFYDPYGYYNPYGIYDRYSYYYYSPFAYRYWGTYSPYYNFRRGTVTGVAPNGATDPNSGAHGRVIQGRGYTQVRPNGATESSGSTSTTASRSGGGTGSSSGGRDSSPRSGGGGGGGVSNQGYSGGGSGGSGSSGSGRTAQPR